ncbi:MAG: gamma-glutamyl-gamma-aminobutyrate hydrolase family protein, partial [Candidatus Puniceispirillum sp.]
NLGGLPDAGSSEFGETKVPLVGLMTEWTAGNQTEQRSADDDLGGTMRLGAYECHITAGSLAARLYGSSVIHERHRHRYEVNIGYRDALQAAGMTISGLSPDGHLPEIVEREDHPFFIAVQFHPELKSKPFDPHPLFTGFVAASIEKARLV